MQEMRIKVSAEQAANIEIIPTSDGGVEIVLRYGESQKNYGSFNKEPHKFQNKSDKSNAEIIKEFCAEKKNEEGVDLKELKSFFNFYTGKTDWKGRMDAEKLWQRWLDTKK